MRMNVEKNVNEGMELLKEFKAGKVNKSDCIRGLFRLGYEVKEISKEMNIIYNMCFNIVSKMILREDLEESVVKKVKVSFEAELIEYLNENKGVKKSEVVKYFVKKGRGEGYVYSNIKKLVESGKISF